MPASPFADGDYVIRPMGDPAPVEPGCGRPSPTGDVGRPPPSSGLTLTMPHDSRPPSAGISIAEVNAKMFASRTALRPSDVALRALIVGLALATGYIHSTLGGLLFTLNAVGYAVAAIAMIVPLALAVRFRWVVRLGLMGYAATTIIGWAITGPYYSTAYIAKGIEVALIVAVAIDFARHDGNPVDVIRREFANFTSFVARTRGTAGAGA